MGLERLSATNFRIGEIKIFYSAMERARRRFEVAEEKRLDTPTEDSPTRNGRLRHWSEKVFGSVARGVHYIRPKTTANEISDLGFMMSLAGIVLSEFENVNPTKHHIRNKLIATGLLVGGFLMDAVDGPYARATNTASIEGAIHDTVNDKRQEYMTRYIMAFSSALQGDKFDAFAQGVAGAFHALPSQYRTDAERNGYSVSENGKEALSIYGNRLVRLHLIGFASLLPQPLNKYFRTGLTITSIIGDISSILERKDYKNKGTFENNKNKREEMMDTANEKYPHVQAVAQEALDVGQAVLTLLPFVPRLNLKRLLNAA